jgi:hypothetical protein
MQFRMVAPLNRWGALAMKWKKHSPEQIVEKLARVRAAVGDGALLADAVQAIGVSEATYFRWRVLYGTLSLNQLHFIKRLELENARLRRALEDLEDGVRA